MPPLRRREILLSFLVAALFVIAVHAWTGQMAPKWDGRFYFDLAERGLAGPQIAPFAYRWGLPFLSRWLSAATPFDLAQSFRLLGSAAAVLELALVYWSVRGLAGGRWLAAFIGACVGLSYYHVRFPLFFWSLVDVATYPWMLLAFAWIWQGRLLRAGVASAVGLLFKEFLLLPWIVCILEGATSLRRPPRLQKLSVLGVTFLLGAAFFLAPRASLEISYSFQFVDPVHRPEDLAKLWTLLVDPRRALEILTAYVVYWLPTLLLVTPARWMALRLAVAPYQRPLLVYLALLLPLVWYGGRNVGVFVSYGVAAQILVLTLMLRGSRLGLAETIWVSAGILITQRWFWTIPDPHVDTAAYLAFHDLGSTRAVLQRLGIATAWVATAALCRGIARRTADRPS